MIHSGAPLWRELAFRYGTANPILPTQAGRVANSDRRCESRSILGRAVAHDNSKKDCLKAEVQPYLSRHSNEPFLSSQFDM